MLAGVAAIAWVGHIFAGTTVVGRATRQQSLRPNTDSRGRCRPGNLADGGNAALSSFLTALNNDSRRASGG
ncbi:MAG: hypothetical protein WA925_23020, partial [Mycobacterium sp.]